MLFQKFHSFSQFLRHISQMRTVLLAVLCNSLITLYLWVVVYGTRTEKMLSFNFLDTSTNHTTGNDVYDGLLNGLSTMISIVFISFFLLAFALYDFKRLVNLWLRLSCVLVNFGISGPAFSDLFHFFGFEYAQEYSFLATIIYGTTGTMVFLTDKLPKSLHHCYVVCNCSMLSVFYLRTFPKQTAWFVLLGVLLWDIFAVLTPFGPLHLINHKAQDYGEEVLRFLMFNTKVDPLKKVSESEQEEEKDEEEDEFSEVSMSTANSMDFDGFDKFVSSLDVDETDALNEETEALISIKDTKEIDEKQHRNEIITSRTAYEALQEGGTTRLGMGDFIFYGLLVGKAACNGSVMATFTTILGIIVGLIIILTLATDYEEGLPALPISIFLGAVFHFATLFIVEPFIYSMVSIF